MGCFPVCYMVCSKWSYVIRSPVSPQRCFTATCANEQCHNNILMVKGLLAWASCQIHKIAGAHALGMPGTFSPSPQVSDPDMHHGTCVTHVPWCMPGSLTRSFLWNRRRGKTFPAFPAHAQPAILRIWYEAHWLIYAKNIWLVYVSGFFINQHVSYQLYCCCRFVLMRNRI